MTVPPVGPPPPNVPPPNVPPPNVPPAGSPLPDSPLLYPAAPITLIDAIRQGLPVKQAWWGLPDAGLAFLLWITFSVVAGVIAAAFGDPEGIADWSILLSITLPWLGLAGWPWLVAKLKGNGAVIDFGLTRRASDLTWGIAYGVAALVLASIIGLITTVIFGEFNSAAAEVAEDMSFVPLLIFAVLVGIGAPIAEELGFRGLLFGALAKRGLAPWLTIVLSAGAFSLFHFEPVRIPLLLGTGLILGIARYHRQSTTVPIVAHMVNNLPAAFVLALS